MITAAAPVDAASVATAPTTVVGGSGFDAILLLQGWSANSSLDAAGFEPADTSDALAGDDAAEDETDDDIDASLAFLANLIAATSSPGSSSPFEGGGGQGGDEAEPAPSLALDADAFALAAAVNDGGDGKADALQGLAAVEPEALDSRQPGDASQNMARAAELLAQAPRTVTETSKLVATHVRDTRWADDFGARVSLMVRAGESTASLQLTPIDLGPVEVNVTVKDSQATIHFGATQADTRALLEASLPRLRELLASQGFNLLDASVSSGFSRPQHSASTPNGRADIEPDTSATDSQPTRRLGLLDLYA